MSSSTATNRSTPRTAVAHTGAGRGGPDGGLGSGAAVLLVARREFVTQVRTRTFLIGLVVSLVFFAGIGLLTTFIGGAGSSATLGLTPQTAPLRPALAAVAEREGLTLEIREVAEEPGRAQVADGELDGLLSGAPGGLELLGQDEVPDNLLAVATAVAGEQALEDALSAAGLDPGTVAAQSQVRTATLEPQDPNQGQQLGLAFAGTFLLFFSLSGYGTLVATGVVEEKQSRVVELLLATIKPWQLLAGKVLGLGGVGLLQLVIFSVIGLVAASVTGLLTVPGAAAGMFVMIVVWYLLGFFLFAALYAAVGSTVSRQEELGSVTAPMVFLLLIPFILTLNLLPRDPDNSVLAVLSYVPFFSQTVMPARYALGSAGIGEVLIAGVIALVAIAVVVRVAGRVYQNSVLRTGAKVPLREALRARG